MIAGAEKRRRRDAALGPELVPVTDVTRSPAIEAQRVQLPAFRAELEITEALSSNLVTFVTGGTGCGKTTQVPQFLLELGFNYLESASLLIGVTEPRRVATTAVARRLKQELGNYGDSVAYQIRHEFVSARGRERLRVMTDGVAMKVLESDFLLSQYSVLVLDEIHERSANCDLLLGILSKVVPLRQRLYQEGRTDLPPLRLVLMSATLDLSELRDRLFPSAGHVHLNAATFPVTCHFTKETPKDYVAAAKKKILQIHAKLPRGSVLVFLTGRGDIQRLTHELRRGKAARCGPELGDSESDEESASEEEEEQARDFAPEHDGSDASANGEAGDDGPNAKAETIESAAAVCHTESTRHDATENAEADEPAAFKLEGEDEDTVTLQPEDLELTNPLVDPRQRRAYSWRGGAAEAKLMVIPLYAALPRAAQQLAFEEPSADERVVIISTNIAETSLTLPNIRYIVDAGYAKERLYSKSGSYSAFERCLISKAGAKQRSGRAGRLGPGHCYRLYSSAVYQHDMAEFPRVQLNEQPLDNTLLYLANLGVPNLRLFPFPSPPSSVATAAALSRLVRMRMLEESEELRITPRGRVAVQFPIHPRYAAGLIRVMNLAENAENLEVLCLGVFAVAMLAVGTEFFSESAPDALPLPTLLSSRDDFDRLLAGARVMLEAGVLESAVSEPAALERVLEAVSEKYDLVFARWKEAVALATQLLEICVSGSNPNREWLSEDRVNAAIRKVAPADFRGLKHLLRRLCVGASTCFWSRLLTSSWRRVSSVKLCVVAELAQECLALRTSISCPLSDQVLSTLSRKEFRKYKGGYVTSVLGRSVVAELDSTSALRGGAGGPDMLCFTEVFEKATSTQRDSGPRWFLRTLLDFDQHAAAVAQILAAEDVPVPELLREYLNRCHS